MNIINRLTLRHLLLNRGRTAMTIIGIVLSVAMVCCVAGFLISARDLAIQNIKDMKGDWHVAYIDVSQDTADKIAGEGVFCSFYTKDGDTDGYLNIYLRLEHPKRDVIDLGRGIAEEYGVETWGGNTELLALEGVIPYDNIMLTFILIAAICTAIIVAGSVIVIANAFYISASERVRQFGLLKSAGATSRQLGRSILFEALVLTAVAIPIGVGLGFLIQAGVLWVTNNLLSEIFALNVHNGTLAFRLIFSPFIVYVSVAIAVLTVLASAWLPARRAAKTSPIDAIRQTKDIQIRSKKLKTSRLTQLLFGFEGTLAAKSLKRSRGKYRATVVSLTVSIILFITMSSFIWVLNKGVEMEYGGYDFDVYVAATGGQAMIDEIEETLASIPDAKVQSMRRTLLSTVLPDGFMKKGSPVKAIENGVYALTLCSMPDEEYAKIFPVMQEPLTGILDNTVRYSSGNKKLEAVPFNCEAGTQLPLLDWGYVDGPSGVTFTVNSDEAARITIGAVVYETPKSINAALFGDSMINILVPESAYRAMLLEHETAMAKHADAAFAVATPDPDAFGETAQELLAPYFNENGSGIVMQDVSQMTRFNRNITLLVMLFGYGFIAMLSLIAVTSVIATISTGMALRRQEFAMLYSVGMTPGGMNKMLNLESLLYGLKSLMIGVPAGVALSYLLYKSMNYTFVFAYKLPAGAMAISAAAVMLLTFGTMRYGKRKLGKISIVEAIRDEAV
ncbi:MAG: ABC transporter permease [Clostridiales bacterium]|nr:ABC transporter permease [Clostridiales bacterium]